MGKSSFLFSDGFFPIASVPVLGKQYLFGSLRLLAGVLFVLFSLCFLLLLVASVSSWVIASLVAYFHSVVVILKMSNDPLVVR